MDRIDLLIILVLIFAAIRGLKVGFLQIVLSTVGFIAGLLLGSIIAVKIVAPLGASSYKLLLILLIEIIFSISLSAAGSSIGALIITEKEGYRSLLQHANDYFGGVFEIFSTLLIIWLVASGLTNVQTARLGYFVQHSAFISGLDGLLPPPPDLIARLERSVTPNGIPNVFVGLEPQHTTLAPNVNVTNPAILNDEASEVKIVGSGCGGVVQGSGFVFSGDLVATAAHVIAGIADPVVVDQSGDHQTSTVYFNPNLDLAVLRTSGLRDNSLVLNTASVADNSAAGVLGFPENGALVTENATVIDEIRAQGQNIYNQGLVYRNIYEVAANIQPGNSGGPLVDAKGDVSGIVFAKSVTQPDLGYALDVSYLNSAINQAKSQSQDISTGSCAD